MKLSVAFFLLLLSLLLIGEISHGSRKEEGEYWKKIMKDEEIPDILKESLLDDNSLVDNNKKEHFMTNFDPHPNAIIYHTAHASTHNNNHHLKINPTLPNSSP
ncbi:organ-specific protein P4 [Benincasa hispida]|uniref:organ-specific protein P4 n=1 Tax=Benincasa hispida TaxID=102211 RepID=UPI0019021A5B|nr:organ-specific protein P4 [Benincasa hispida]